ncbi:MAG: NrfD/PsrC family molybdoenzyme membrane anchor subunit [Hyphomicrobiales bacterium]
MLETFWGLPVIGYLFLAGVGAGAYTVSASVLLVGGGGGFGHKHFQIARYGALLAPLPMIVGTVMIIFELGTFRAAIENGDFWLFFRWINLFLTINMSPMSIGSWILAICIVASLVYAYTFLSSEANPGDDKAKLRRAMAWAGLPLGIAVAIYTGVMLGAMPSRPFWNSPVLALLFLMSALSGGVAGILFLKAVFDHRPPAGDAEAAVKTDNSSYLLSASDMMLIGFELLAVFLFIMFAYLTVGAQKIAISVILPGGTLSSLFWIGFVLIGLLIPAIIELKYVVPTLLYKKAYTIPRGVEMTVAVVVLFGGFLLRYVVVIGGQITGPVGI